MSNRGGSGSQSSSSGSGGFRGGRGGSQGSRGDNLSQQMGRMNIYSQHPPPRSTVPRVGQPGDLVGSAQHPNAPFPKASLAHHQQEFAKRPKGSVYERPAVGTKTELLTNHVLVHLPQQTLKLYCYHIEVYQNKKVLTKREEAGPIFYNLVSRFRREFPDSSTFIFNDVNMLWTMVQLPKAEGEVRFKNHRIVYKYTSRVDFGQTIREDQDRQLLATLVDAIATHRVRNPACSKYTVYKQCIFMLQTVPENPDEVCNAPLTVPLGHGLDARIGISIAVRLNLRAGITACFDTTHKLFTRTGYPLIRLLCELINGDTITDGEFENFWDERLRQAVVTEENRKQLDEILSKMRLRYSRDIAIQIDENGRETVPSLMVCRERGKLFKYYRLTPGSAANTYFPDHEGREWTVAEWFLRCCNIRLRYPNLPCFERKPSRQRPNFCVWPMEFVTYIPESKRFDGLPPVVTRNELIEHTTIKNAPQGRALFEKIIGQNQIADCPPVIDNNDPMMQRYGLTFEKEMLNVKATVLPAATVEYGGGYKFQDKNHEGEWEAVTHDPCLEVLDGSIYVRNKDKDEDAPKITKRLLGSILNVCSPLNRRNEFHYDPAGYHHLMKAIERTGQPVAWENKDAGQAAIHGELNFSQNRDHPKKIIEFLEKLKENANAEENNKKYKKSDEEVLIPLVWIVFEVRCSTFAGGRDGFANEYNFIKYLGDSALGVYTQGILSKNLSIVQENPITCKLTRLIVEKVLGKVGTTHRKLEREGDHKSWTKLTDPKSPTLVLGVDVSHPSPRDREMGGVRSLSVASVVGNIDFDCTEFRSSSRIQDAGAEMIVRFQDEISARLYDFQRNTGVLPAHIVMYRDGLGETDFQRILWEERRSIEQCCKNISVKYDPTITYIVVTKRHHTKFFLKNHEEGHEKHGHNILPGTLVEEKVTTNTFYDFFLATQIGQTGIARPTHYYVLHDTWDPYVAFWPTVTHALTYLFCRTTSVVSLPSPVLYAHLAAKRAKEHIDGAENYARIHKIKLSFENVHDVEKLTKAINVNSGLDGMTFV
ncbi:unnamed protein product [Caenorhabditis brenneri]